MNKTEHADKQTCFSILVTQNCRKYLKLCYVLTKKIDQSLLHQLECFGIVETISFKKYSSQSNDTFKILAEDEFQISGVINDYSLHLAVAKNSNLDLKNVLEAELINWLQHD